MSSIVENFNELKTSTLILALSNPILALTSSKAELGPAEFYSNNSSSIRTWYKKICLHNEYLKNQIERVYPFYKSGLRYL